MERNSRIYIAGHSGLVGTAIRRSLKNSGFENLVFTPYPEYDLRNQQMVEDFFKEARPDYVFLAAARVGGIMANNTYPAEFAYDNLMIQSNVIHAAYKYSVKKLLFLGSSCIYPKHCPQPIREEYLLTGPLETTNEAYAIAKIAGLKLCSYYNAQFHTNFISVMPTNLYGPGDNYNLETSHVLPAFIRKFWLARRLESNDWTAIRKDLQKRPIGDINGNSSEDKILNILTKYGITIDPRIISHQSPVTSHQSRVTISLWGSGEVFREFMHVNDLADALLFLMEKYDDSEHINIGTGIDCRIRELAQQIKDITGFSGDILWDKSKPDGTPKKLLNVEKLQELGWKSGISLEKGLEMVIRDYHE